jgi:hypothetical protein
MSTKIKMPTFEEYWETSPKFGSLESVPVDLAKMAMASAYMAGLNAGLRATSDAYEAVLRPKSQ